MRVSGVFDKQGFAYVKCLFLVKKFSIARELTFLIDTGVSKTIISESDALRLKLNFAQLSRPEQKVLGIGGFVETYAVSNVELWLVTENGFHKEKMKEILVTRYPHLPLEVKGQIPSLLGRDLLNRFALVIDKRKSEVLLTDKEIRL